MKPIHMSITLFISVLRLLTIRQASMTLRLAISHVMHKSAGNGKFS